jgi:GSCFA family.
MSMKWMLDFEIPAAPCKIGYRDKLLFIGSCFTQEIGSKLKELKFNLLQNPHGILYDPVSISGALDSYMINKRYASSDLVQLNDLWHSWQHHSQFSAGEKAEAVNRINASQTSAHDFINGLDWLLVSVGSAFHYVLTHENMPVANCHKAPSALFKKELLDTEVIREVLGNAIQKLKTLSPQVRIILTVSPVRHIRDGLVQNNRSKARLLEAVHSLTGQFEYVYYFPAYEILIDELRDYRFYKKDLVHPDEMAIQYIFEKFAGSFIDNEANQLMQEVNGILTAVKHTPLHKNTQGYNVFKKHQLVKVAALQQAFPFLDLGAEIAWFQS